MICSGILVVEQLQKEALLFYFTGEQGDAPHCKYLPGCFIKMKKSYRKQVDNKKTKILLD